MDHEFLKTLKPGDKVIVAERNYRRIRTVERLTETLIIVNGTKFRKQSGTAARDGYNTERLEEATPEALNEIRLNVKGHKMRTELIDFLTPLAFSSTANAPSADIIALLENIKNTVDQYKAITAAPQPL